MIGRLLLKRYLVISFLGSGNSGSAYLARDQMDARVVVVKVIHPHVAADTNYRLFLETEVESLTRLRHPNVVELFGMSWADPVGPCMIMEFIPGVTLETLLKRHGRLGLPQVMRLLTPLCQALHAGHGLGITHRDLKPANLMVLDPDTPQETQKVMDFGFSQLAARPYLPLERLRGGAEFVTFGTPLYLAPECGRGDPVDQRSDLYSVGVILFELLTGMPPFFNRNAAAIVTAHIEQAPPSFAACGAGVSIPAAVEKIVRWCLSKFPNERPQTAEELQRAFCAATGMPFDAMGFPTKYVVPPATRPLLTVDTAPPVPAFDVGATACHDVVDAWMPEPIAIIKIRGFVDDHSGEIVESKPGHIHVRFSSHTAETTAKMLPTLRNLFTGNFAITPEEPAEANVPIDMHMLLETKETKPQTRLQLRVFVPQAKVRSELPTGDWHMRAQNLVHDLRSYLMAQPALLAPDHGTGLPAS